MRRTDRVADTKVADIIKYVSARHAHVAEIVVSCRVGPTCRDMSATSPAKVEVIVCGFGGVDRVVVPIRGPTREIDLSELRMRPKGWGSPEWG